jgi:hypothetical protein
VWRALTQTASQATNPDNTYGFGLIDAYQAVNYHGPIDDPAERNQLLAVYPNPFSYSIHSELTFLLDLEEYSDVRIELYNILGQSYGDIKKEPLAGSKDLELKWDGLTLAGRSVPSGVYFYRVYIGDYVKAGKVTLLQ